MTRADRAAGEGPGHRSRSPSPASGPPLPPPDGSPAPGPPPRISPTPPVLSPPRPRPARARLHRRLATPDRTPGARRERPEGGLERVSARGSGSGARTTAVRRPAAQMRLLNVLLLRRRLVSPSTDPSGPRPPRRPECARTSGTVGLGAYGTHTAHTRPHRHLARTRGTRRTPLRRSSTHYHRRPQPRLGVACVSVCVRLRPCASVCVEVCDHAKDAPTYP